jgi:hypothetical protein
MRDLTAAALDFAVDSIKRLIDTENSFYPDSLYEMTGTQLRDYLAYAYLCGRDKVEKSRKVK